MLNRLKSRIVDVRRGAGRVRDAGRGLAAAVAGLAVLALLTPLAASFDTGPRVGVLLAVASLVELMHGFRCSTEQARRRAWQSATITAGLAVLLISAPLLAAAALVLFVAGAFALDGVRLVVVLYRQADRRGSDWRQSALGVAGNIAAVAALLAIRARGADWTLAVAGALRMFGVAWTIATTPVLTEADAGDTAVRDLGIPDHPALAELGERLEREETARRAVDRGWVQAFLATLFAIHLGRIGLDRSAVGVLSPAVAVLGDMVFALVIAFGLVIPFMLVERRLARPFERRAWQWRLAGPSSPRLVRRWSRRLAEGWLDWRLRLAIRLRLARFSMTAAVGRGLQIGLPFAAILAATVPLWGMSWYFDTENWAAGVWNSWAESRTDTWREAMVRAVVAADTASGKPTPSFTVNPPGVVGGAAFSFIVIGDTGEGDASQHVLRDQLLKAAAIEDVRFVVLSSDVVYPTGAMRDYEAKFWLPFKGVEKPVYAIPGNHDWYDALEAFVATFYEPAAAQVAMRARVDADGRVSTTTDARIEALIRRAADLRGFYRVPTGYQQAPYFQVQTDEFALIAVDTGVLKCVDPVQMAWLDDALKASDGKMTMAVLGHPFYAGGARQDLDNEAFSAIHRKLQAHRVPIVMAGDTHDLEYYVEREGLGAGRALHFVNGGGGAYLSFGTALAWPSNPATPEWAFYPTTADVTGKIEDRTPWWKRPAWWWTRATGAWPFSPQWLSAAFDYNVAPFFQSFVEVRVEPATRIIRLRPWGVHGRLRWGDLQRSQSLANHPASEPVEWVVPLAR
jgi:uncharacterized membrane protein HdeD (DUF308 family)/3',5'-cyclic AMP phosphodiesterase CpdA